MHNMQLFIDDFDKRFFAEVKRQNPDAIVPVTLDELDELRKKARFFDILMGASKREVEAMWDFMNASGARYEPLIEELANAQRVRGV
jgi:hypothetical protein